MQRRRIAGVKEPISTDELLKVDESCAKESAVVFGELGPNTMACADAGLQVFSVAAKWVGRWEEQHALNESFNRTAEELGISGQLLYDIVSRPPDPGEDARITSARGIDKAVSQALARRTLFHLLWRAYRWGLADLRRLKLTAAAGYMRVEAETIALLLLFQRHPDLSERWLNPKENMNKFFRETQGEVKEILEQHKLTMAYEHGSAVAQHARFASAARGIRQDGTVLDQEFDPQEPVSFHLGLAYFLRMQKRILALLPTVFAGLGDDEGFNGGLAAFTSLEDKTWWVMERKYENEVREFHVD